MSFNRSRQQLPSTWDKNLGPDDKGCLRITGNKVKYIGEVARAMRSLCTEDPLVEGIHHINLRTGPGDEDKDAASVRADHPIPSDVSLYYYEVQVINRGRDGFVGKHLHMYTKLQRYVGPVVAQLLHACLRWCTWHLTAWVHCPRMISHQYGDHSSDMQPNVVLLACVP